MKKATQIVLGIIIGFIICIFMTAGKVKEPVHFPIFNKYEDSGKCYLLVEVEVTPEEYIGFDIGDDYTVK